MAKTITGKRAEFGLEFYWRGKRKIPSVSMWSQPSVPDGEGGKYEFGIPEEFPEFEIFYKAARDLCAALVKAGELD